MKPRLGKRRVGLPHLDPADCNPRIFTKKHFENFRPSSVVRFKALECSYVSLKNMIPG
jgi:hypothetical protein